MNASELKELAAKGIEGAAVKAELAARNAVRDLDNLSMDFLVGLLTFGFNDRAFRAARREAIAICDERNVSPETRRSIYKSYGVKM